MNFLKKIVQFFYGSIKHKLIFNVVLIHAVLMGFVVYDLVERQSEFMENQLENQGKELATLLAINATIPLLNNDLIALDELYMVFMTTKISIWYFYWMHVEKSKQVLIKATSTKHWMTQKVLNYLKW